MLRSTINSDKLIEEVQKRPALYDFKATGNNDSNARRAHWEEIAKELFLELWATSTATEKEALVKEVQAKWKNLRDAYIRVRKQEKDEQMKGIVKSRKKYIFYDKLSFLELTTRGAQSANVIFLEEHEEKNDDSMESINLNTCKTHQEIDNSDHLLNILQELVKMQKEDRVNDRMGNKKFLLSLLPFMEKLPDDVNLEVRLQLMSILQTYTNGESFMKA
ncbi:uncharacterized protein LOC123011243 [Tribolium madens]|uniref:uncharacterized protein LOC123011243 n=1 Tax=Tribolium madens TaxID=41895 RepID=UPI001CF72944|nr:uncharacterized protein LOC123011243 [Tribolium madens]